MLRTLSKLFPPRRFLARSTQGILCLGRHIDCSSKAGVPGPAGSWPHSSGGPELVEYAASLSQGSQRPICSEIPILVALLPRPSLNLWSMRGLQLRWPVRFKKLFLALPVLGMITGGHPDFKLISPFGLRESQFTSLTYRAFRLRNRGDYRSASRLLWQAAAAARTSGEKVEAFSNLAWFALLQGDLKSAQERLDEIRELSTRCPNAGTVETSAASFHISQAMVDMTQGHYGRAQSLLSSVQRTFDLRCRPGDEARLYHYLGNLARICERRSLAHSYYRQALDAALRAYPFGWPTYPHVLIDSAILLQKEERYHEAQLRLRKALWLGLQTRNPRLISRARRIMGSVYRSQGRYGAALTEHLASLREVRSLHVPFTEAKVLIEIGRDRLCLDDGATALVALKQAAATAPRLMDQELQQDLLEGLARSYEKNGELEKALSYCRRLISVIEDTDLKGLPENAQAAYRGSQHPAYEEVAALLMRIQAEGRRQSTAVPRYAFVYADASRTRALRRATQLQCSALPPSAPRLDDSLVGSLQAKLAPSEVFIEFMLGEQQSFAWFITSHDFQTSVLPPRPQLEEAVRAFRESASRRPSGRRAFNVYYRKGAELFALLFKPERAKLLRSAKQVVIVSDGVLQQIPFEALLTKPPASGADIEDRALAALSVRYVPSALTWIESPPSAPGPQDNLLIVGPSSACLSPGVELSIPLPRAETEAENISRSWPRSSRVVGKEVFESAVTQPTSGRSQIIHFAGHARIDQHNPEKSGLMLGTLDGRDRLLSVEEISRLNLRAELVTLSACETGLGRLVSGEGSISLAWAFSMAGARNVIVSLWKTEDQANSRFMTYFYQDLQTTHSIAASLRNTRLAFLRSDVPAYRHPYFWAPFVVISGDREKVHPPAVS